MAGLSLIGEGKDTSEPIPSGDSLSLTIGSWLGIPALPFVTLYKVSASFIIIILEHLSGFQRCCIVFRLLASNHLHKPQGFLQWSHPSGLTACLYGAFCAHWVPSNSSTGSSYISRLIFKRCNKALPLSHRIGNIFELMEILNNKLAEIPNLRVLSQRPETKADGYLAVDKLLNGDFANDKLFRTVSPALAFQYVSANKR